MATDITNDSEAGRYEAHVDGELAGFADYSLSPGTITLTHTEVDDRFEGQGVGSDLARHALDDAKANGLRVVPECPFIKSWMDKHPDYADLERESPTAG